MDRFPGPELLPASPFPARRHRTLAAAFLGFLTALPLEADAFPLVSPSPALAAEWTSFLNGGSPLWASRHAPLINLAIREEFAQALGGNDPTSNPMVQYLLWRHDLNPARFDYYHPHLGSVLENLPPPTVNPCPCNTNTGLPTNPTIPAQQQLPPVTPLPQTNLPSTNPTTPLPPIITLNIPPPSLNPVPQPQRQGYPPYSPPPIAINNSPEPSSVFLVPLLIAAGAMWQGRRRILARVV